MPPWCLVEAVARGLSEHRPVITAEPGRTIKAGLVAMESCSGDCNVQQVATGWNVSQVWTEKIYYGRGTGYYRVNATWVDDQNVLHQLIQT